MTDRTMSLEAFRNLLDRCGGNVSRWPIDDRPLAVALVNQSPEARALLDETLQIEKALRTVPKAPDHLTDRIFEAVGIPHRRQPRKTGS